MERLDQAGHPGQVDLPGVPGLMERPAPREVAGHRVLPGVRGPMGQAELPVLQVLHIQPAGRPVMRARQIMPRRQDSQGRLSMPLQQVMQGQHTKPPRRRMQVQQQTPGQLIKLLRREWRGRRLKPEPLILQHRRYPQVMRQQPAAQARQIMRLLPDSLGQRIRLHQRETPGLLFMRHLPGMQDRPRIPGLLSMRLLRVFLGQRQMRGHPILRHLP